MLVSQKPGSAKGGIFMTTEDETGIANLVNSGWSRMLWWPMGPQRHGVVPGSYA